MWQQRNGLIHLRLVGDSGRGVLYTTKEAALAGEICFADTIRNRAFSRRRSSIASVEGCFADRLTRLLCQNFGFKYKSDAVTKYD